MKEYGEIWKWIGILATAAGYVPDLFDRRLHNLILVPAQLKHDGGHPAFLLQEWPVLAGVVDKPFAVTPDPDRVLPSPGVRSR